MMYRIKRTSVESPIVTPEEICEEASEIKGEFYVDVDDLAAFARKYGRIIISFDDNNNPKGTIEIYDDWRE